NPRSVRRPLGKVSRGGLPRREAMQALAKACNYAPGAQPREWLSVCVDNEDRPGPHRPEPSARVVEPFERETLPVRGPGWLVAEPDGAGVLQFGVGDHQRGRLARKPEERDMTPIRRLHGVAVIDATWNLSACGAWRAQPSQARTVRANRPDAARRLVWRAAS